MSQSLEDRTARGDQKVTERPSGLDEPLAQAPPGVCVGGTRNRGSFVVNEASAVLTKRRESAVFRPQDQRSRAAAAVGSGGFRRSACTPFYPQRCGHPLWGQRMRGRLAIFRSALVGGLAAAVVLPHRVPIYGGIYGTAGRTTAASISHQPPSDRQSASVPRSGRGPEFPTSRPWCLRGQVIGLNLLVRLHVLRVVHDSVIST